MEWKTCEHQKSAATAQTFAAVHAAIVIVWGNRGLGACPKKNCLLLLELLTLQHWKMPFCKIGDLLESQ